VHLYIMGKQLGRSEKGTSVRPWWAGGDAWHATHDMVGLVIHTACHVIHHISSPGLLRYMASFDAASMV
jgi:hypothetical protein